MKSWPFDTVLIANRGEIALRIIRSVHALGLKSVAVFSEADAEAPHTRAADRAVCLGPAPAAQSYLKAQAVIDAARAAGAQAIHPGYGFLSENAEFVDLCAQSGLIFIGPPAEAVRVMGDKRLAKERMLAAGVPCIPGYLGDAQNPQAFRDMARQIGYPVMIKAAAGGGGRGMRLVRQDQDLEAALEGAASEARNAFADGTLYLEKALFGSRHVEVQVLADAHGHCLHLGERDCSIQRRHQKVVEESPSPAVTEEIRRHLTSDALAAARAVGYVNAGTVEFLLDEAGQYYFLEMNTRLQVEHPVTECVTGLDLVDLQLRVAAGEPLPFTQEDVTFRGHAIEVRLCAEDPAQDFLPCTGTLNSWSVPSMPGVRVDTGVANGQSISPYYDSMLAKIIAYGCDREEARRRLASALERSVITGVPTNKDFLARILRHPEFAAGRATTDFLSRNEGLGSISEPAALGAIASLLMCWPEHMSIQDWTNAGPGQWVVRLAAGLVRVTRDRHGVATVVRDVQNGSERITLRPLSLEHNHLSLLVGSIREHVHYVRIAGGVEVCGLGMTRQFVEQLPDTSLGTATTGEERLIAPISGRVLRVNAAVGDGVAANGCVLIIEAMKMECEVRTRNAGVIGSLHVAVGSQVSSRQLLATVAPRQAES
jgi:geranyl-CoA carboxylase alpha subunit